MGVDSMHCMDSPSEPVEDVEPNQAKNSAPQNKGESMSIAECPEGAQEDGGAEEAYLLRVANQLPWVAIARVSGIQDELY